MIRLMQGPFPPGEGVRRHAVFDGLVECPVHGHADLEKCTSCSYLVRLEDPEGVRAGAMAGRQVAVVCGYQMSGPQGGPSG